MSLMTREEMEANIPSDWRVAMDDVQADIEKLIDECEEHAWFIDDGEGSARAVLLDIEGFFDLFTLRSQAETMDRLKGGGVLPHRQQETGEADSNGEGEVDRTRRR